MYKKVYRQKGGLAEQGYLAQIREASRKAIEDWKERTKGEVAQKVRTPVRKPLIPQRIKKGISSLVSQGLPSPSKGISSLVPDTVKTLTTMPETLFKSYLGDDNIRRTPEMDRNLEDIIKKQNTGLEGKINYSDYGFPDFVAEAKRDNLPQRNIDELQNSPSTLAIPTTRKQFMDIINAGPAAITNALTLGRLGYSTDPTTGKVSFTSGEFNFPTEGTILEPMGNFIDKGGIEGWVNRIRAGIPGSGGMLNEDTQNPIKIQPENIYNPNTVAALQYGDIEAQAEAARLRQEQITNNPYIGASHNSPMWFGGFPLQSGDTLTEKRMRMDRQGFSRPYRTPNNLTLQYNDDGTGTIVSKPPDEMETAPGYTPDNWFKALEYYNPNYEEQRANYFKRDNSNQYLIPAGQPTGFEGTGYGQFSPQPTTNIEVPPEVAQNVAVSVTTPGYYNYQEGLNRVLYPGLSGSTGFQNQQQGLPSLMK